jgi:UDP-3-O-[3-hydroxymyristoyl] glucosamine N-acyltransferase
MTRRNKVLLGELFPELGLLGDFSSLKALEIRRIAAADEAGEGDLVFIGQDRLLPLMEKHEPTAFVVSDSLWEQASPLKAKAPLLRSRDALLAFAKASRFFSPEPKHEPGIHPAAIVHPEAKIGKGVHIGPFALIEEGAEIGDGAVILARVQVGARAKVGKGSLLFPGVVLYHGVVLGERVRVHANTVIGADGFGYSQEKTATGVKHVKIHHMGTVRIGNDVEIGASTTIDRGTLSDTLIGDGCIIDNQVQIGHNCVLEEGVIVCGGCGLAGSAYLEKFALLAGMVGVANRIRVGAGAQVAALTPLTSHVPPGGKWGGNPNMPLGEFQRLQVLFKRLPELFERKRK